MRSFIEMLDRIRGLLAGGIVAVAILAGQSPSAAQTAPSPTQAAPPNSDLQLKIDRFLELFGDVDLQKWLEEQRAAKVPSDPAGGDPAGGDDALDFSFADFTTRIRNHVAGLIAAAQSFPSEIDRARSTLAQDLEGRGDGWVLLLVGVFLFAGLVTQWLFGRLTRGWHAWIAAAQLDSARARLTAIAARLLWGSCHVLAFALGSIGAFLAFDWPPLVREIVVAYLFAAVVFRLAVVVLDFLLSPAGSRTFGDAERLRIIPVTNVSAAHWKRRLSYAVGWFAFGWVTIRLLGALGFSLPARQLVAYSLGVVLLVMGIEAIWRRPADAASVPPGRIGVRVRNWLWTAYFTALWLLWALGAIKLFWVAVFVVALPGAAGIAQRAVRNVLRPAGEGQGDPAIPSVLTAIVERGIRAAIIVGAIVLLAQKLGVELTQIADHDSVGLRLVRGLLSAGVIVLLADFIWHGVKTLIDRKLAEAQIAGEPGSEETRRRARMRTLLPILRNVFMIFFVAVAAMMTLSSLGVEIGPLIAGAGVVGVAVGFGAQSVVKDIISGMFYLLDDAFRVGEYIQSGSYKGTIESFSLRSVKLRHHRGAIFIVPFSELGAVQNMSRDWVIEKFVITVTYDADVDKARKIIKKIGQELYDDPEFRRVTIEPLKLQGLDELGDSGLILKAKIKTLPGEQFTIKRRALVMIHKAFQENGIKLAFPTVHIAGEGDAELGAAAGQLLAKQKAAAALEAAK